MSSKIAVFVVAAAMVCLLSGTLWASSSFLSTSGAILTPDDTVLGASDFSLDYHQFELSDKAVNFGANVGVTSSLELGIARFDSDKAGADPETILNAKYLVLAETVNRPSLLVGLVDATGELDPDDNPGFYAVIGKNLTPLATGFTGEPVNPIKGYVGIGSGIYNGLFAGVEWTLTPKVQVMGEFINELNIKNTIAEKSVFNVGARLTISESLTADIANINGDDWGFGLSYVKAGL